MNAAGSMLLSVAVELRQSKLRRKASSTAGCIDTDLHPQVEVTPASQANLSSRSHTCIMQCGSCSLKTRCEYLGANTLSRKAFCATVRTLRIALKLDRACRCPPLLLPSETRAPLGASCFSVGSETETSILARRNAPLPSVDLPLIPLLPTRRSRSGH